MFRQAETELKRTLQMLSDIQIALNESCIVAVIDSHGYVIYRNELAQQILGYSDSPLTPFPIRRVLRNSVKGIGLLRQVYMHLQSGAVWHGEVELQNREREIMWFQTTIVPFHSEESPYQYIAVSTDISVQKQEELNRREREEQLYALQEELESFIDNTADAITVTSLSGKVLQTNPSFERMYGWTAEEVVGHAFPFEGDEKTEILRWLNLVKAGGRVVGLETVRHRKNGEPINISITASPIRNPQGEVIAMSAISRDITNQLKDKELLHRSEKLSLIGQMAAGIVHEIRNPLTSLRGFTQLIEENSDDLIAKYCDIMLQEFHRIDTTLNELLLLAKPQTTHYAFVNIRQTVEDVITLLQMSANDKNIVLVRNLSCDDILVRAAENELKQVFINILKNAVEATPNGLRISVDCYRSSEGRVVIRCTDEGTGMSGAQLKKLGQPFFTTKSNGTGLGLMMSQQIIQAHGGRLEVWSEEQVGTSVTVTIPICKGGTKIKVEHNEEFDCKEREEECHGGGTKGQRRAL